MSHLDEHVQRVLSTAPPLSDDQLARIATLLRLGDWCSEAEVADAKQRRQIAKRRERLKAKRADEIKRVSAQLIKHWGA
jgi:hypothetical protein